MHPSIHACIHASIDASINPCIHPSIHASMHRRRRTTRTKRPEVCSHYSLTTLVYPLLPFTTIHYPVLGRERVPKVHLPQKRLMGAFPATKDEGTVSNSTSIESKKRRKTIYNPHDEKATPHSIL
jgi:hypothetical protein